jgi:2-oxoglutarate dehydrogenase E1 component
MEPGQNFHALSFGYLIDLYERFQRDPNSVDPEARAIFAQWTPTFEIGPSGQAALPQIDFNKLIGAVNLAQTIRSFGHRAVQLDPLGHPPPGDPYLDAAAFDINEDDLRQMPASVVGGPIAEDSPNAFEAIHNLRIVYTQKIGYDYGHIHNPQERDWLREKAECGEFRPPASDDDLKNLLIRLTQVESLEQFLQRFFPGKTRFSIEGLDMMVPMLDEVIDSAAEAGICEIQIGMGHRGRLNVLAHVLTKPYEQILAEFKDPADHYESMIQHGWTGDVKYHAGASRAVKGGEVVKIVVIMPPNPSHLEMINPILEGMTRAAQTGSERPGTPGFYPEAALPILIHGDGSFPGEGIVAETLNLSHLPGYQTAGSVHIIANNQLGFTTSPVQGRSTLYASDLAKGFEIPIMHVNADDPQACIEAARTAFAYRHLFHKDFLIDLVGYRRYGHNEGDEPAFTQPVLYQEIEHHPTVRKILADKLIAEKLIEASWPDELMESAMQQLHNTLEKLNPDNGAVRATDELFIESSLRKNVKTAVPAGKLQELNQALLSFPKDFHLYRKLERAVQRERKALEDQKANTIDWGMAERLAMASVLADGIPIRLTGQDVERGTFSQRHAVFHDANDEHVYIPLQEIPQARASFEIQNSPLSEEGVLGFEFGYNMMARGQLVIWEAQYGDFVNNAQTVIDEFIVSGRAKWEQNSSLVLLLPHAYEGQGPNHSSARMERFLQMASDANMRIANCTRSAQYFHLLRLQATSLGKTPVPLIVFTPKSLLRHPLVASSLNELSHDGWKPVLDDSEAVKHAQQVRRIALCTGKMAIDLIESEFRAESNDLAIVRLEQLYPFPKDELNRVFDQYDRVETVTWVQEEPENMGAWNFVQPKLAEVINERWQLQFVGRKMSSSPAEGSSTWHSINQKALIDQVYHPKSVVALNNAKLYEE